MRLTSERWLALVIGTVVLLGGIWFLAIRDDGSRAMSTFLDRVVHRDDAAAELLFDPRTLTEAVRSLGLAAIPASVSISYSDLKVSRTDDGTRVRAFWHVILTRGGSVIQQTDQEVSGTLLSTDEGPRLEDVQADVPVKLPLEALVTSLGTSEAEAQEFLSDFEAGTSWLDGIEAALDPEQESIPVEEREVSVTWATTDLRMLERPGVPGVSTTWVLSLYAPDGTLLGPVPVAQAITRQMEPARVRVGTYDAALAKADAYAAAFRFVQMLHSSGAAALAMVAPGAPSIEPSGWAYMKESSFKAPLDADTVEVKDPDNEGDPMTAKVNSIGLVRQGDRWLVDASHTDLIVSDRPMRGGFAVRKYSCGANFGGCSDTNPASPIRAYNARVDVSFVRFLISTTNKAGAFIKYTRNSDYLIASSNRFTTPWRWMPGKVTATWDGQDVPVELDTALLEGATGDQKVSFHFLVMPNGYDVASRNVTIRIQSFGGADTSNSPGTIAR